VTKKEIVKVISERANLTQLKTKEIVQWTFDAIIDTLIEEGRIELRNFGVFEVRQRKARKARNPRTGESVEVESSRFSRARRWKKKCAKPRLSSRSVESDARQRGRSRYPSWRNPHRKLSSLDHSRRRRSEKSDYSGRAGFKSRTNFADESEKTDSAARPVSAFGT
jgi:nucleoid DNA-binding protein